MIVWITKHALTAGIIQREVDPPSSSCPSLVCWKQSNGLRDSAHGEGRDWHRTKESAIAKAEDMRKKKIASLKKQIEKLEKMTFE